MQTLKAGSKGEAVKVLQRALLTLGLLENSRAVDGDFGPKTEAAVRRFQRSQFLAADGIVGPKTWAALQSSTPESSAPENDDRLWDSDGWYRDAITQPIHAGRIGSTINPYATVVHTTDMFPGTMAALLRAWTNGKGKGNAAHFLLGRQPNTSNNWPNGGLVQMIPIYRNGNHAGSGGSFITGSGTIVHPNRVSVGIEIDCAGRLGRRTPDGKWVYKSQGKVVGEIPETDVYVDARGVGWHKVTDYQFQVLDKLLRDLDNVYRAAPSGLGVVPKGTYQINLVTWGAMSGHIVGHVTLNPDDKTDPGPQVMDWLRSR